MVTGIQRKGIDSRVTLPVTKGELVQASKAIHDEIKSSVDARLADVETELVLRLGKSLDQRITKVIAEVVEKSLADLERKHQESIGFLKQAFTDALSSVENVVRSLQIPSPQILVTVPESKPPDVIVNVPEALPSPVEVILPDMQPNFSVNVPQQKSADVVVNVPPPRRLKKSILYNQHGQPVETLEEEVKD